MLATFGECDCILSASLVHKCFIILFFISNILSKEENIRSNFSIESVSSVFH